MSMTMKAVGFTVPGFVENLSIVSRNIPLLKDNECLLKVYYSALNRADILQRRGLYPPPPGESNILGLEAVGIIQQEATNGSRWRKNDRVMALLGGGGNAEYVAVNEKHLIKMPDWMSMEKAAAIPEAWLTAFQLLFWVSSCTKEDKASLSSPTEKIQDKTFLVHAGASGVGSSLIQLLKNVLGVKNVFSTVGSDDKKKFLEQELKVTRAFNYKKEDEANFDEHIHALTGKRGVDVAFDCVGASYWEKNIASLAMDGEWILYGTMGGANIQGDILAKILRKRVQLKATTLRNRSPDYKHLLMTDFEAKVLHHFRDGQLKPIIDQVFSLSEIADAHKRMEANLNVGKILLKVFQEDDYHGPVKAKQDL